LSNTAQYGRERVKMPDQYEGYKPPALNEPYVPHYAFTAGRRSSAEDKTIPVEEPKGSISGSRFA